MQVKFSDGSYGQYEDNPLAAGARRNLLLDRR